MQQARAIVLTPSSGWRMVGCRERISAVWAEVERVQPRISRAGLTEGRKAPLEASNGLIRTEFVRLRRTATSSAPWLTFRRATTPMRRPGTARSGPSAGEPAARRRFGTTGRRGSAARPGLWRRGGRPPRGPRRAGAVATGKRIPGTSAASMTSRSMWMSAGPGGRIVGGEVVHGRSPDATRHQELDLAGVEVPRIDQDSLILGQRPDPERPGEPSGSPPIIIRSGIPPRYFEVDDAIVWMSPWASNQTIDGSWPARCSPASVPSDARQSPTTTARSPPPAEPCRHRRGQLLIQRDEPRPLRNNRRPAAAGRPASPRPDSGTIAASSRRSSWWYGSRMTSLMRGSRRC